MSLNTTFSFLISLFAAFIASGCATGAKFTSPKTTPADTALVYVFRPSNPPLALKPKIVVNGTTAANLTNKGYFDLELQPGSYTVKADWSWGSGVPDSEVAIKAEGGHTYYVMIDSSMHTSGYVASAVTVVPIINFQEVLD